MGINRPSMYAAFGNKESLFEKVVDRYMNGPAGYAFDALNAPTAREAAKRLLDGSVDMATAPKHPGGCLLLQSALACGKPNDAIRRALIRYRKQTQELLRERFERGQAEGDLADDCNADDLARFISGTMHGIAVQSLGGATRDELSRMVDIAMRAWPDG